MSEFVRLTSAREARMHAREHLERSQSALTRPLGELSEIEPLSEMTDYIFDLQSQVEKEGPMDYHKYASKMWQNFFGQPENEQDKAAFEVFENSMIARLHGIDMTDLVYPHVVESFGELLKKRGQDIKEISLWSTGDVTATGYQNGKIDSSKVIPKFIKAIAAMGREQSRILADKTRYMVRDDKIEEIGEYVQEILDAGDTNPKIVIIEDTSANFGKVEKYLQARLGESASGVTITSIWATYSREGQQARPKPGSSDEEKEAYKQKRSVLNAIDSLTDLLSPNFDEIFDGARVCVDFDGVIGDNVEMRRHQARAIYQSLTDGAMLMGLGLDNIEKIFENSFQQS